MNMLCEVAKIVLVQGLACSIDSADSLVIIGPWRSASAHSCLALQKQIDVINRQSWHAASG